MGSEKVSKLIKLDYEEDPDSKTDDNSSLGVIVKAKVSYSRYSNFHR